MASNDAKSSISFCSEHLRAGRALLQWSQKTLAEKSNVSLATIKRLEPIPGQLSANTVTISALKQTLEQAGVIFIQDNEGGPGARLASAVS